MTHTNILPKSFYHNLVVRLLLLAVTALGFTWALWHVGDEYILLMLNLGLIFIIQIWLLFRFIQRIDRELIRMFEAIWHNEYNSKVFDPAKRKGFDRLREVMDHLQELVKQKSVEIQEQEFGFQEIINMSPGGLIILIPGGQVIFSNPAAKSILNRSSIYHINDLGKYAKPLAENLFKNPKQTNLQIDSLLFRKTDIIIRNEKKTLLAFEDISHQLIQKETESWKKLIRVIRHEIMNSISPIPALSKSIRGCLHNDLGDLKEIEQLSRKDLDRIDQGLETIELTSISMLEFVNRYRQLTALPEPHFQECNINQILIESLALFEHECQSRQINATLLPLPETAYVRIDPDLIKRVIINLFKNAIEALNQSSDPCIVTKITLEANQIIIEIQDNGQGMEAELLDQIFVPFFTTKPGGSGIGLTLSRQIMLMHHGELNVQSSPRNGSIFRMLFQR